MLKKLTICILTLLMISVFGVAAHAEDLPELTLEELIQWKESTRPEYITEDMLDQIITGNLYEEYYGVTAAATATPLRAFATCDRAMFQVGIKSTMTVHTSGATAPYIYSIKPFRRTAGSTGPYSSFGVSSSTSTLSITPDDNYQYLIDFTVTAANGDYVSFYNKYETVTKASLSNANTVGGKVKAVIASEIKTDMTDREKALAIHEWLTHNAKYDRTYTNYGADGVLLKGSGVCDSYALAFQLFMSELGIPNVYVTSGSMNHAWNMIYVDGGWYHVDVTWDDPIGIDAAVTGLESTTYFCVTDSVLSQDHTWNINSLITPPSGKGPVSPEATPISAPDVTVGKTSITISSGSQKMVRFTVPVAGIYLFETTGKKDTFGCIYDSNFNQLFTDDNSGSGSNFQLSCFLSKSAVVYIGVEYILFGESGTETLNISRAPAAALGNNSVPIPAGKTVMLSFTAPSDDTYVFETTGSKDTIGYLYDEKMTNIAYNEYGGQKANFKILHRMKKGQAIAIAVTYHDTSESGTETLHISSFEPVAAPNTTLTTLNMNFFSALPNSGKPTLLVLTKAGCWNCSNMLRQLGGYDLSVMNVVVADSCNSPLDSVKSFYAQYASEITGATMGYAASTYMVDLLRLVESSTTTILTPVVFYIDANNMIKYYTTGYDIDIIARVQEVLGVTLQKTTFSGSRLVPPESTTTIGAEAFKGTAAKLIEIPASCTSIASTAFDSCPYLKIILNHSGVAITPPAGVVVTDIPLN